jgi:hypothetical protein
MKSETLKIIRKIIRKATPNVRIKKTYYSYIAENEKHKHKLKAFEGSVLFEMLEKTVVSSKTRYEKFILVDGIYSNNDKLMYVTNFRIM